MIYLKYIDLRDIAELLMNEMNDFKAGNIKVNIIGYKK